MPPFHIETETIINNIDLAEPKFNLLAFLAGLVSFWTLPFSLLVLFLIKRKHIRRSLIYGWIVGILIWQPFIPFIFD